MKIIGIVLLTLLLLIFLLTLFSIRIYISFDKKSVRLSVKYLFLQLFKLDTSEMKPKDKPDSEQKPKKPEIEISEIPEALEPEPESEPEEPADEPKEEPEDEKSGNSLLDKWNVIKGYLPKVKTALKKLLKLIKIDDLELHLTVGGEDAAAAGMNFGKINAVFYNALALVCCLFSVKIKKTEIKCDYENKVFEATGSLMIKARILSILALAVYILINYVKIKSSLDALDKPEPESKSKKEGST